jgi:diguanylate cyclase (GGDEF)-like protein/putative nucleotidyltransferase with HDIG domain
MRSKSLVKKINAWHASICSFAMMLAFGSAALWGQPVQQETSPPVPPQAEQSPAPPSQAPPAAAQSDSEQQPGTPHQAPKHKSPLDELDDLEPPAKASAPAETESLHVLMGWPLVVTSPATIARFSVADPNIVDLVVVSNNEILVVGKQRGRVSLVVWDATGQSQQFDINVEREPPAMPDQLLAALSGQPAPGEAPEHNTTWIYWVVVGSILLAGGTILGAKRRRRPSSINLGLQTPSSNAAGTGQGIAAIAEPHESSAVDDSHEDNTTDGLAGLQACGRFIEAVGEECRVSARRGRTFSVILVDLDGLKPTGDRDSQSESKQILTVVAKLLEARSRQPNLVASYGRGKFAVLLPGTDTHQAETVAERLRTSVETHAVLRARAVTASIGIATYPDHGGISDEILKLADSGVQLAKLCKGNCVKVLPPVSKPGNAERNERLLEKYFDLESKSTPPTAHGPEPGDSRNASTTATQKSSLLDTITALAFAVDAKGPYTTGHSQVVSRLAARIAIQAGLSVAEVEETRLAGLVHDIGKIHVPESVCNKPDQLTTEEFEMMSRHSAWGAKMLEPLNVKTIESIVRHHHERFDGKGYPDRLAADKIPLGARIVAVAESFHSMLSDLPYKSARSFEDALAELRRCSGMQFDPKIVMAFLDWIQSYASSPERQKA